MTVDRPRVVVVSRAWPALGGIPTFVRSVVSDRELRELFDIEELNTTRRAVRPGGALTVSNIWEAIVDAVRVFRAARHAHVVHVNTALVPTTVMLRVLVLCRAAKLGGAAVLCHVHTSAQPQGFAPSRLRKFLLRRLGFVHAILAVSNVGAEALRPLVSGAVEVVDNAVDVRSLPVADTDSPAPTIVFVGTITPRKGLLDLLTAVRTLRERGVGPFRLELIGGAAEAGEAEADVVRTAFVSEGMGASLLGPLAPEAVRERLGAAGIFVLPSHWEGQPISVIEAMGAGLPIVATRTGAIPDMVRDDVDGFLVDVGRTDALADALGELISSAELRRRMGSSARSRALELFDITRLRAKLSELYASAARTSSRN
jgi:glycosyltransferase involved in cell wall biosynthesis